MEIDTRDTIVERRYTGCEQKKKDETADEMRSTEKDM